MSRELKNQPVTLVDCVSEEHRNRGKDAGAGAAIGAMVGSAVAGLAGAAVGGALGAATGALVGDKLRKDSKDQ